MVKQEVNKKSIEALLMDHPDLEAKLREALEADRFFIAITYQRKYKPEDTNDLHHFWSRCNFLVQDVPPSIEHVKRDFLAAEMPHALPDDPAAPGKLY